MKRGSYHVIFQERKGTAWQTAGVVGTVQEATDLARRCVKNINRDEIKAKVISLDTGNAVRNSTITRADVEGGTQ